MFWHGLTLKVKSWVVEFLMCASADSAAELTHFSILYFHAETPGCPPDVCTNDPLFHDARWFAARPREQGQSEGVAASLYTPLLTRSSLAAALLSRSSFGGGSLARSTFSSGAPGAEQLRRRRSWCGAALGALGPQPVVSSRHPLHWVQQDGFLRMQRRRSSQAAWERYEAAPWLMD